MRWSSKFARPTNDAGRSTPSKVKVRLEGTTPLPPTFFCKSVIPGQLFLRLYKSVILRDLFFAGFWKRFSPVCADSKRLSPLTMRPGRRFLRKLLLDSYKSVILNELLCPVANGWICEEALPRILERRDSNSAGTSCLRVRFLGEARATAREDRPARGAWRPGKLMWCTPIPSMFYIFYRVSKEGLWKCGRVRCSVTGVPHERKPHP